MDRPLALVVLALPRVCLLPSYFSLANWSKHVCIWITINAVLPNYEKMALESGSWQFFLKGIPSVLEWHFCFGHFWAILKVIFYVVVVEQSPIDPFIRLILVPDVSAATPHHAGHQSGQHPDAWKQNVKCFNHPKIHFKNRMLLYIHQHFLNVIIMSTIATLMFHPSSSNSEFSFLLTTPIIIEWSKIIS